MRKLGNTLEKIKNTLAAYLHRARTFCKKHKMLTALALILLTLALLVMLFHPHGVRRYLILGIDHYGSLDENGRSDVMMLVQVDFDRADICAVTFARDMFIVGENGRQQKINTIVRNQDEDALARALESNFGLSIDGWFRVNFSSVISIIDAIGGVQVELTKAEARYIDSDAGYYPDSLLEEGLCTLNGGQALSYARCRKLDNDIGRNARQGKLFSALLESLKHMNMARLADLYRSMNHAWRSSLSGGEQVKLVASALYLRGASFRQVAVPFEGHWRYGNSSSGESGIVLNIEDNAGLLSEALSP